jgi:drug/metabolite transporter (DMT)-like permease
MKPMSETSPTIHLFPGVPFALGSAVLFGATPPLAKTLLESVPPIMLAGLLYLGAGVGLLGYRLARNQSREARLGRSDLPWLALAILTGGVIGPVLLMLGLSFTSAANGSLLLNLESLATMAIAWIVYRENVDRRLLLGAFTILAGAVLLSWQGKTLSFDTGALLVAGACLAWGLDNNFTRKISAADPVSIAMLKGLVAGVVNIALALAAGFHMPPLHLSIAAGFIGIFGIGVSLVLFILALRHLGTARTGAYYSTAPFIGAILAVVFLGEPLTVTLVAAALLMAIGLWLHLSERHEHEHMHEAMEHEHRHVHDEHHRHTHSEPVTEPHSHRHRHEPMRHKHPHYPDLHHRHGHG